jgi:hypothetical protein
MIKNIKYQLIKIVVDQANASVKFNADTDKMYKLITGIHGSVPKEAAIEKSELELKIADLEVFPEGFEFKLIATNLSVSPNKRFYEQVSEEALGNKVEGRFIDGGNAPGYPYTAKLYLRLEERV